MTPAELFSQLCLLYPREWPTETRTAWAQQYADALHGISQSVLDGAYSETMKKWKSLRPPQPGNILENIRATPVRPGSYFKPEEPWPFARRANRELTSNPKAKAAVQEGWGLGLWEFIARRDRMPSPREEMHIMDTNNRFWELYGARQNGQPVEFETAAGSIRAQVPECSGLFEAFIRKREKIVERFGQGECQRRQDE